MTQKQSIQGCKTLENGKNVILETQKNTTYQNQTEDSVDFFFFHINSSAYAEFF